MKKNTSKAKYQFSDFEFAKLALIRELILADEKVSPAEHKLWLETIRYTSKENWHELTSLDEPASRNEVIDRLPEFLKTEEDRNEIIEIASRLCKESPEAESRWQSIIERLGISESHELMSPPISPKISPETDTSDSESKPIPRDDSILLGIEKYEALHQDYRFANQQIEMAVRNRAQADEKELLAASLHHQKNLNFLKEKIDEKIEALKRDIEKRVDEVESSGFDEQQDVVHRAQVYLKGLSKEESRGGLFGTIRSRDDEEGKNNWMMSALRTGEELTTFGNAMVEVVRKTEKRVASIWKDLDDEKGRIEAQASVVREKKEAEFALIKQSFQDKVESFKAPQIQRTTELWRSYNNKCRDLAKELGPAFFENVVCKLNQGLEALQYAFSTTAANDAKGTDPMITSSNGVIRLAEDLVDKKDIYIIGDLHGDWASYQSAFQKSGFLDNDDTILIFIGDYGDRGPSSFRILFDLLSLKVQYPDRIFTLRGNHESFSLTEQGWVKAGTTNLEYVAGINCFFFRAGEPKQMCQQFVRLVEAMPTVILLGKKTIICHGFIPPAIELVHNNPNKGIPSEKQFELFDVKSLKDLERADLQKSMRWQRFEGKDEYYFIWPDNHAHSGIDDWDAFKEKTGVKYLVRGHDPVAEGYKYYDCGVLTLNSSTDVTIGKDACIAMMAQYCSPGSYEFIRLDN